MTTGGQADNRSIDDRSRRLGGRAVAYKRSGDRLYDTYACMCVYIFFFFFFREYVYARESACVRACSSTCVR